MDEPKILVAIRKRPLSKKEQSKGQTDIISVKNQETVIVSQYKQKVDLTKYLEETVFNFDFAFDQATSNQQIYESAVRPLVDSAFQGAKVTCFAYGQTGSGKTFTMNGNFKMGVYGLYTLGANDIFSYLSDNRFRHLTAKLSFFEIYCGKLFDLLNKRSELTLREDNKSNINIIGLEETPVDSLQRFQELLSLGSLQRVTSQNSANNQSSRSHAILQVTLKEGKKIFGKISFIDLAGNQRGADHTDMKKQTRIDGAQINKSLLSLKQCIRALDQGKGHTPFRGSKLTMVLKDSFVGFCRTIMIGNVSPSSASSENTLNTLRYADRVKQLRKPTEGLSKEQLKARQMMLPRQNNNAIKIDINKDDDADDIEMKRKEAQKNYGIKQQSPPIIQKQTHREMSSDPYKRNAQQDKMRQPSFGANSVQLARPLVGGLKQPQPPPQQINTVDLLNNQNKQQPKSPAISANLGKINLTNQAVKGPMSSDRNNYQNNSQVNNYNQKNIDTRMDIQSGGMTNSQILNKQSAYNNNSYMQNYSSVNNNNNPPAFFQPNQNFRQDNNSQLYQNQQPYNYPNQNNYQNAQQNPYQIPYQNNYTNPNNPNLGNNKIIQHNNDLDRLNQYKTNYQQNDLRPRSASRQQYQPQGFQYKGPQFKPPPPKIVIPEDFDGMIEFMPNVTDPDIRQQIHQRLHQQLYKDENDLIQSHSQTLRSSLDHLKSEMTLISDFKINRNAVPTREYLSLMQESIDEKISLLQILREKMMQFSYRLERVEQIDEQNENIIPRGEDQQLLDDLH